MYKTFVYVIYEAGNFNPALDFCVKFGAHNNLSAIIYCPYFLPDTESYIEKCKQNGIVYVSEHNQYGGVCDVVSQINESGIVSYTPASVSFGVNNAPILRMKRFLLRKLVPSKAESINALVAWYHSKSVSYGEFLSSISAKAVFFAEYNVERDSCCWLEAASKLQLKTIIISYGSITPDEAAIAYYDNPEYSLEKSALFYVLSLFSKWCKRFKSRNMIRLPVEQALAIEFLGYSSKNPWVVNSGSVDYVVLESDFMRQMYVANGIDASRIKVCGSPSLDKLSGGYLDKETVKSELYTALKLDPDKGLLVCAIPPNQYPGVACPEATSYEELLAIWFDILREMAMCYNVVISTHPSARPSEIKSIENSGFSVSLGGIAELLPITDIYFASVSSTIKWALACGVPVVNYDCYQYDHPDYADVQQVDTFMTADEVKGFATQYLANDFLLRKRQEVCSVSLFYGVLEGGSVSKISQLIN